VFVIGILPMIDNFAHIGGFLMGILTGIVFLPSAQIIKTQATYRKRLIEVSLATLLMLIFFLVAFILLYLDLPPDWCPACLAIDCVPIANFQCSV
jgi:hypothetical protein